MNLSTKLQHKFLLPTFVIICSFIVVVLTFSDPIAAWILKDSKGIMFQSFESRTEHKSPIFNEIRFWPGKTKDIWTMQQSHGGLHLDKTQWHGLAIVVDKSKTPKVAEFFQLRNGESKFNEKTQAQPFQARCFACHSNGPRAIRFSMEDGAPHLSWKDRVQVFLWNLRIKSYGVTNSQAGAQFQGGVDFRSPLHVLQQPLVLQSCQKCHSESGLRNPLKLEQIGTAIFQIKNGLMPPFPFRLSEKDRQLLRPYWDIN